MIKALAEHLKVEEKNVVAHFDDLVVEIEVCVHHLLQPLGVVYILVVDIRILVVVVQGFL